jgi:hypothetical protein
MTKAFYTSKTDVSAMLDVREWVLIWHLPVKDIIIRGGENVVGRFERGSAVV